ncbi:MAG TPA: hypothetical protein VE528_05310 [Thermoleophilaceae bacterium]|jgi:hypothetical protein|nr:hypothetical protein [Thermoleophilaceae bacterium]
MGTGAEFVVICFFLGLSAGVIGKIKGSSFVLWFLVGACTFGLGTVAALLYRIERNEPERRCPTCGRWTAISHQVCTRCGEDLDWVEADLEPPIAAGAAR